MDNLSLKRRELLAFLGAGAALSSIPAALAGGSGRPLIGISPVRSDALHLAKGLDYQVLIAEGDAIGGGRQFGTNNDYIALIPDADDRAKGMLWVNHESFTSKLLAGDARTKANIDIERAAVGGSVLRVEQRKGKWQVVPDARNRRVDGAQMIPFVALANGQTRQAAQGTMANCAGGVTPWGTFLSCEENYQDYYGDRLQGDSQISASDYGWEAFYRREPEDYGWVVEIDPQTGQAQKHLSLGRFSHESATCVVAANGCTVVYSGDDKAGECLYKFVAAEPGRLDKGTLYVASLEQKRWLALDIEQQPILRQHFSSQLEVLTYLRKAAHLLQATPLNRPEDIEIHPLTGDVYLTLTNNKKVGDFHGRISRLTEKNGDPAALEFEFSDYLIGEDGRFSCPDNLAFDRKGNLWFCSDISGSAMGKAPYESFGNNGLFVVPASGPQAGEVIQLGSAPFDAELTGLCFTPDQQTLLLAVQHPGERTKDLANPTSRWPTGEGLPRSAVVQIQGRLLRQLTS